MSDDQRWSEVDAYIESTLMPKDAALQQAITRSRDAGLPDIHVTPTQGRLLQILAMSIGARRVLEIGTLGGFSTIWLARALSPGGKLLTLELKPEYARVARSNIEHAGVADRVEIRVGPAADSLKNMTAEADGRFDFVFIDADKESSELYIEQAIRLSRPGTLIVLDNAVREGEVANAHSTDARVHGTRRALELMGRHPRLLASCIQTVGQKGYDGFALALVRDASSAAV
jgi:predicted O-methyltransferase YrrM